MPNGSIKISDTNVFTGYPDTSAVGNGFECTNPKTQVGGFASPSGFGDSVLEALGAATKVTISGTGVVRVGAPNQFSAKVSLATGTLQLTGHTSDAQNTNTDPAITSFTWYSRQRFVAMVDVNGLVTLIGRGSCTIECRFSRAVNLPFDGARPSGTDFAYATLDLTVKP